MTHWGRRQIVIVGLLVGCLVLCLGWFDTSQPTEGYELLVDADMFVVGTVETDDPYAYHFGFNCPLGASLGWKTYGDGSYALYCWCDKYDSRKWREKNPPQWLDTYPTDLIEGILFYKNNMLLYEQHSYFYDTAPAVMGYQMEWKALQEYDAKRWKEHNPPPRIGTITFVGPGEWFYYLTAAELLKILQYHLTLLPKYHTEKDIIEAVEWRVTLKNSPYRAYANIEDPDEHKTYKDFEKEIRAQYIKENNYRKYIQDLIKKLKGE